MVGVLGLLGDLGGVDGLVLGTGVVGVDVGAWGAAWLLEWG